MALSEHEKRLLDQMEAALLTEDPKLATTLSGTKMPISRNRNLLAVGLLALGLATIFGGLIAKVTFVGVIGFLVALSGLIPWSRCEECSISTLISQGIWAQRTPRKALG